MQTEGTTCFTLSKLTAGRRWESHSRFAVIAFHLIYLWLYRSMRLTDLKRVGIWMNPRCNEKRASMLDQSSTMDGRLYSLTDWWSSLQNANQELSWRAWLIACTSISYGHTTITLLFSSDLLAFRTKFWWRVDRVNSVHHGAWGVPMTQHSIHQLLSRPRLDHHTVELWTPMAHRTPFFFATFSPLLLFPATLAQRHSHFQL